MQYRTQTLQHEAFGGLLVKAGDKLTGMADEKAKDLKSNPLHFHDKWIHRESPELFAHQYCR